MIHPTIPGGRGFLARRRRRVFVVSAPQAPQGSPRRILVSACLLGVRCRHDGRDRFEPGLRERAGPGATLVPACPEELGGLGTPRASAELRGGDGAAALEGRARVVDVHGRDVTEAFVRGAERALSIARAAGATEAWLTERSPSCGCRATHVDGAVVPGPGVAAALLARAGLAVSGVGEPGGGGRG
jgi:uncharacterized protein YbbK (DUF523 family)